MTSLVSHREKVCSIIQSWSFLFPGPYLGYSEGEEVSRNQRNELKSPSSAHVTSSAAPGSSVFG